MQEEGWAGRRNEYFLPPLAQGLSLGARVQLRWVLGSLLVEKAPGWKGAEMSHRQGKEGWVGAGHAVLARSRLQYLESRSLGPWPA